jgi:hypothetical protein
MHLHIHCPRGHAYTEQNTYRRGSQGGVCVAMPLRPRRSATTIVVMALRAALLMADPDHPEPGLAVRTGLRLLLLVVHDRPAVTRRRRDDLPLKPLHP